MPFDDPSLIVHFGVQNDFRVLRILVAGAARRLRDGGQLWLVAQTYVPVGVLLARQAAATKLCDVRAAYDDGRFTVWAATRVARRETRAAGHKRSAAADAGKTKCKTKKRQRSS